jgi:hypothetical protein
MLESERIRELEAEYWKRQDDEEQEIEHELETSLHGASYLSREHLESVIRWKTLAQGGRAAALTESLKRVSDEEIVLVTNAGLSIDHLRTQIEVLSSVPGIGVGVATAALGFVYPESHVVVDYTTYNGVFGAETQSISQKQAVELIQKLRAEYGDSEHTLREIDRALFVKFGGFED